MTNRLAFALALASFATACSGGHSNTFTPSTDGGASSEEDSSVAAPPGDDSGTGHDGGLGDDGSTSDAGPPKPIDANDYDRTCTTAADCVAIVADPSGGCQYCACPNAAINKSDLAKEQAAANAWNATCPANPGAVCGACQESIVVCNVELCQVVVCDGGVCPDGG